MGSTYYSLHYHWVCSTKERRPFIRNWKPRFHEYIGGTVRGLGGEPLKVGGVEDHVHALLGLKTTHCLADFSRELKKATSVWAKAQHDRDFEWQEGYAVFSVSPSLLEKVALYIDQPGGAPSEDGLHGGIETTPRKARCELRSEIPHVISPRFHPVVCHPSGVTFHPRTVPEVCAALRPPATFSQPYGLGDQTRRTGSQALHPLRISSPMNICVHLRLSAVQ